MCSDSSDSSDSTLMKTSAYIPILFQCINHIHLNSVRNIIRIYIYIHTLTLTNFHIYINSLRFKTTNCDELNFRDSHQLPALPGCLRSSRIKPPSSSRSTWCVAGSAGGTASRWAAGQRPSPMVCSRENRWETMGDPEMVVFSEKILINGGL